MQVINSKGLALAQRFVNLFAEIPCFLEDKALGKLIDLIDPIRTLVTVLVKLTRRTDAYTASIKFELLNAIANLICDLDEFQVRKHMPDSSQQSFWKSLCACIEVHKDSMATDSWRDVFDLQEAVSEKLMMPLTAEVNTCI